jgi:hypothetical protein
LTILPRLRALQQDSIILVTGYCGDDDTCVQVIFRLLEQAATAPPLHRFQSTPGTLLKKVLTGYTEQATLQFEPYMSAQERVTIKIPKTLYMRLASIIEGTGFSSVTDFVVYVMRDVASSRSPELTDGLNKEEIDAIKKRLKSLGYL